MNGSDNVRGADNQQERLWICGWIAGFVDGEGCFSVPIFRNHKAKLLWQVQPTFVVAQSASSRDVLEELVSVFGCGKVYVNQRHDNHREPLARYCVGRFADLRDVIVPFFEEHQLRTAKRENFDKFVTVLRLMEERKHLTVSGLIEIAEIAETMNHRKPSEFLRILRDHTPTISCSSR
jgi:LAGLIDADG endonuclease